MAVFQSIVEERRNQETKVSAKKTDMMDALLEVEEENGRKLNDEEIIDVLLMYLNAGHESSGHITMWATIFLQENQEFLQKAKVLSLGIINSLILCNRQCNHHLAKLLCLSMAICFSLLYHSSII